MMLADYVIKIDWVVYPAVVGAAGLALTVAVRILRRVDLSKAGELAWIPLLILSLGGMGFVLGDMPKDSNAVKIPYADVTGSTDNANDKRLEVAKLHYEHLKNQPTQEQSQHQSLLPSGVKGIIFGISVALLLCAIVSLSVWVNKLT